MSSLAVGYGFTAEAQPIQMCRTAATRTWHKKDVLFVPVKPLDT
jgi:hypothetical protein